MVTGCIGIFGKHDDFMSSVLFLSFSASLSREFVAVLLSLELESKRMLRYS